jgi:hypothetical protein
MKDFEAGILIGLLIGSLMMGVFVGYHKLNVSCAETN